MSSNYKMSPVGVGGGNSQHISSAVILRIQFSNAAYKTVILAAV